MAINTVTNDNEMQRAAALREEQNKARSLARKGVSQDLTGKAMKKTGDWVDSAGGKVRKGGTNMIKAGARLSGSGIGAIAGVPLMAVGGLTAAGGLAAQGVGKTGKVAGGRLEKSGNNNKIRAAQMQARNIAKGLVGGGEAAGLILSPVQATTSSLLKAAWINLIPSFGLTLIWINIHAFLRWASPSLFCKLGREWLPKTLGKFTSASNSLIEIGESMLLVILDATFAAVIVGALMLIMKTVETVASGGDYSSAFLGGINPVFGAAAKLINSAK